MARYNLRSRKTGLASSPSPAKVQLQARVEAEILSPEPLMTDSSRSEPPSKKSRVSMCRRKVKRKKSLQTRPSSCTIYHLPQGINLYRHDPNSETKKRFFYLEKLFANPVNTNIWIRILRAFNNEMYSRCWVC